jgi:molybdopterin-binding protein
LSRTSTTNPEIFRDKIEKIVADKIVLEIAIQTAAGIVTFMVTTGEWKE